MATPGVYSFERIDPGLPLIPLAARRVLDGLGRKLSLRGWLSLSLEDRCRLVRAGTAELVDLSTAEIVDRATPASAPIPTAAEPNPSSIPGELAHALGPSRPLDEARWNSLRPLDRYVLVKCAAKPERFALAYEAIVTPPLSHLTTAGEARMVDIGSKTENARRAVASARVRTTRGVVETVMTGSAPKGDVLAAARIAGISAAKRTAELIPLCHPVRTTRACIDFEADAEHGELRVRATIEAVDRTGVEMEAMMAASVASLTLYDMIKSADRWATIDALRLDMKSGGNSGDLARPRERGGS
jgi:cyclic pyranopterin monophosphate synthase